MMQSKLMSFFSTPKSKESLQKVKEKEDYFSPAFPEPETELRKSQEPYSNANSTPRPDYRSKSLKCDLLETMDNAIASETKKLGNVAIKEMKITDDETKDFDDQTPEWALPDKCMDKNKRRPGDENYDPSTLYIPPADFQKLTPTMKQYWEIKSENFDKVIFFKLGKFYELFYEDAVIGKKYFDLNFMGKKMHAGFPEKALEKYAIKFVEKGFKVSVVEQTETPKEMNERLNGAKRGMSASNKKEEKTIQRKMVEIMTKGTYNSEETNANSQYLFAIRMERGLSSTATSITYDIGVVMLETTVNQLIWASFEDDSFFTKTKSLVAQMRPKELVFEPGNVEKNLLGIFSNGFISAQLSKLPNTKSYWHQGVAQSLLQDSENLPNNEPLVMEAMSGCLSYLKQCYIQEKVLSGLRIMKYDQSNRKKMILDSQALQHLEVFNSIELGKDETKGSIFSFINYTVTPFGKRLLRKWLASPLYDVDKINERYTAVEDFQKIRSVTDVFRREISKLPDMERKCGKLYQNAIKASSQAVYFEDVLSKHLVELKSLFDNFRTAENLLKKLAAESTEFNSSRLRDLITYKDVDTANPREVDFECVGILPMIRDSINEIESLVSWEGQTPKPIPGLYSDFDLIRKRCVEYENQLFQILQKERQNLHCSTLSFCHSVYRYQIEAPDNAVSGTKKPKHFEFTTKRSGYQRFHTDEIKEVVELLEAEEEKEKRLLGDFVSSILIRFREKYRIWDNFLAVIAEIDCLISLSLASEGLTRPITLSPNGKTILRIVDGKHPTLPSIHGNQIPNSVNLSDETCKILMLSGPNMGGKSTLLRMVSNLIILAQVGCFVPAQEMEFTLVDQIFTRLGASDNLFENKSTFYIEMEETLKTLKNGTRNSFAIMDELGRGTSTFDGVAIAYATLRYLASTVKCNCIFATHFHVLLEESKLYKEIGLGFMDAIINEKEEKVIFLYKLKAGACHSSFGVKVAKSAGLNSSILQVADRKASEFENRLQMTKKTNLDRKFNLVLNYLIGSKE